MVSLRIPGTDEVYEYPKSGLTNFYSRIQKSLKQRCEYVKEIQGHVAMQKIAGTGLEGKTYSRSTFESTARQEGLWAFYDKTKHLVWYNRADLITQVDEIRAEVLPKDAEFANSNGLFASEVRVPEVLYFHQVLFLLNRVSTFCVLEYARFKLSVEAAREDPAVQEAKVSERCAELATRRKHAALVSINNVKDFICGLKHPLASLLATQEIELIENDLSCVALNMGVAPSLAKILWKVGIGSAFTDTKPFTCEVEEAMFAALTLIAEANGSEDVIKSAMKQFA